MKILILSHKPTSSMLVGKLKQALGEDVEIFHAIQIAWDHSITVPEAFLTVSQCTHIFCANDFKESITCLKILEAALYSEIKIVFEDKIEFNHQLVNHFNY